jgi:hypothetical protein
MGALPSRDRLTIATLFGAGGVTACYAATRVIPLGVPRDAAVASVLVVSMLAAVLAGLFGRRLPTG